jgi:hypothetical protein
LAKVTLGGGTMVKLTNTLPVTGPLMADPLANKANVVVNAVVLECEMVKVVTGPKEPEAGIPPFGEVKVIELIVTFGQVAVTVTT